MLQYINLRNILENRGVRYFASAAAILFCTAAFAVPLYYWLAYEAPTLRAAEVPGKDGTHTGADALAGAQCSQAEYSQSVTLTRLRDTV